MTSAVCGQFYDAFFFFFFLIRAWKQWGCLRFTVPIKFVKVILGCNLSFY